MCAQVKTKSWVRRICILQQLATPTFSLSLSASAPLPLGLLECDVWFWTELDILVFQEVTRPNVK